MYVHVCVLKLIVSSTNISGIKTCIVFYSCVNFTLNNNKYCRPQVGQATWVFKQITDNKRELLWEILNDKKEQKSMSSTNLLNSMWLITRSCRSKYRRRLLKRELRRILWFSFRARNSAWNDCSWTKRMISSLAFWISFVLSSPFSQFSIDFLQL